MKYRLGTTPLLWLLSPHHFNEKYAKTFRWRKDEHEHLHKQ